jgi:hypothetical protein
VVETGQASADLHLNRGAEIMLATSSRGTLYSDRLVLQQGQSELSSSSSYKVEAKGLRVTATAPNSRGLVSVTSGTTVEVAAIDGAFGITNAQGVLLASVRSGKSLTFSIAAGDATVELGSSFKATGLITTDNAGHYFITVNGAVYQIEGQDVSSYVNKTVQIKGRVKGLIVDSQRKGDKFVDPAIGVINIDRAPLLASSVAGAAVGAGAAGAGTAGIVAGSIIPAVVIGSVGVAAAVGIAVGLHQTSSQSNPASN